ncbi:MAG: potassium transporter TrkA [Anaerolineae bacterium]|nr:MAG: potassium transporter TrkA [Anaerolineae bacterium]
MSRKPTLAQRIRYQFDNLMSAGTPAMIGMLAALSLAVIFLAAAVVSMAGFNQEGESGSLSFGEAAWASLMRTLDSGTMGGDTGSGFRLVMLFVTLGGVFVVSTLIGVLGAGVEGKLEELRKGRSLVLESNHTIILGWSTQVFTIIPELIIANQNQKRPVIVVLADRDKVEMEDEIRSRIPDSGNTRIICRSGSPVDPTDIDLASPHSSRAIIVLPPEEGDADSVVIKTILAITNNPNRRPEPYNIVTQMADQRNLEVVKMIGVHDNVHAILVGELIARITAQTSRQSGLSVVYSELLDFGGDEIYFKDEPALAGKTYSDALHAYPDSTVIGLVKNDTPTLSPKMDTRIEAGDRLIAISADDDTIVLGGPGASAIQAASLRAGSPPSPARPESALLIGWNASAGTIVNELEGYVVQGSRLSVVASPNQQPDIDRVCQGLTRQQLTFHPGDTTDRALLDTLGVADYDHVIVLADTSLPIQDADARTLVTLLHMRDMAERDETPFSIVSEMLDMRNRQLAESARVDDFIVSDHLISLMLAQLSENGALYDVFTDLFDPEGVEIYLKPAADYVTLGQPVNFYTLVEAARQRGETALGYRLLHEARDPSANYGVHTNPRKSDAVTLKNGDKLIVLAEE